MCARFRRRCATLNHAFDANSLNGLAWDTCGASILHLPSLLHGHGGHQSGIQLRLMSFSSGHSGKAHRPSRSLHAIRPPSTSGASGGSAAAVETGRLGGTHTCGPGQDVRIHPRRGARGPGIVEVDAFARLQRRANQPRIPSTQGSAERTSPGTKEQLRREEDRRSRRVRPTERHSIGEDGTKRPAQMPDRRGLDRRESPPPTRAQLAFALEAAERCRGIKPPPAPLIAAPSARAPGVLGVRTPRNIAPSGSTCPGRRSTNRLRPRRSTTKTSRVLDELERSEADRRPRARPSRSQANGAVFGAAGDVDRPRAWLYGEVSRRTRRILYDYSISGRVGEAALARLHHAGQRRRRAASANGRARDFGGSRRRSARPSSRRAN